MHLKVMDMLDSSAPQFFGQSVLLTYKGEKPARYVAARFMHEDFSRLHVYEKNQHGVFFLVYPLPGDVNEIRYRISVDGLWKRDSKNKDYISSETGPIFSVIYLDPERKKETVPSTDVMDNEIRFSFSSYSGRSVSLVGDFNNWDPFMHPMLETRPGHYEISLRVSPGRHMYYFLVDGEKKLDPAVSDMVFDKEGNYFSLIRYPPPPE
ncbi:MAG: hypothetical protein JW969_21065 [Spirochaetales bacterium]|nr:hypothetical protein [Spirochaetales bacterium]